MENVDKWLKENFGYGEGHSRRNGCGLGNGNGFGDGLGSGDCLVNGNGYGDRLGDEMGCGYGGGCGRGCYGRGAGGGLKTINNLTIYIVDDTQTIIEKIHKNIAKGKILLSDLTFTDCYIAKGNGYFAHGKTVKEAVQSLQEKIFENLDIEDAIDKFLKIFEKDKKYKGAEFFTWHHYLTGSCLIGREEFIKGRNLSLDDEYTVDEFISICQDAYGKENILKLKEKWEVEDK